MQSLVTLHVVYGLSERYNVNGHPPNVSPISGKLFVLIGAGGAGRAMAFGARSRGARVVVFNRSYGQEIQVNLLNSNVFLCFPISNVRLDK